MKRPARRRDDYADIDTRWLLVPLALAAAVIVMMVAAVSLPAGDATPDTAAQTSTWHGA